MLPPRDFEPLTCTSPAGAASTPSHRIELPLRRMPAVVHVPAPDSSVGRSLRFGSIRTELPEIVIVPVATIVTPRRSSEDWEMVTLPAT